MGSAESVPQRTQQPARRTVQVTADKRQEELNEKFNAFKVTEDYERDSMTAGHSSGK